MGHFYKWLAWWLLGGYLLIVGFLPSDTNDEYVWMTTEENGFIIKELKCIYITARGTV